MSVSNAAASFDCQKCHRTLKVDLEQPLQESTISAFKSTFTANESSRQRDSRLVDQLTESFIVLPNRSNQSNSQSAGGFDRQIETLTNILLVASEKCEFDHPFCLDCSKSIKKELTDKLAELESDRDIYKHALTKLNQQSIIQSNHQSIEDEVASLEREEQELISKEKELEDQLLTLENERKALEYESNNLMDEEKQCEKFEQDFWKEFSNFSLSIHQFDSHRSLLEQQITSAHEQLSRLKRTNVLDDAFHIYFDGHFGTINGFRLGRLPSQPVDWIETNAGFGQVLLLVSTLARMLDYQFQKYRLHPMGSFSRVSKVDEPGTMYELFGSSDSWEPRLFWFRRCEAALVGVLTCVKELQDHIQAQDSGFTPRYAIKNDEINGFSVKIQFHGDGKWTKAMKYMVTAVKDILRWTAQRMQEGVNQ